jgi:hypothetical protein
MSTQKRWIQAAALCIDDETGEILVRTGGAITKKRAKLDCASDAAAGNELVALAAAKKICPLGICLIAAEEVDVTFYSGPADTGTALSGPIPLGANGGFVNPIPSDATAHWIETAAGEALTLLLSAAVQVSGYLVYYEK